MSIRGLNIFYMHWQVQILVENKKKFDLRKALELAANVQPVNVDSSTLNDVRIELFGLYFRFSSSLVYDDRIFSGTSICYPKIGTIFGMYVFLECQNKESIQLIAHNLPSKFYLLALLDSVCFLILEHGSYMKKNRP